METDVKKGAGWGGGGVWGQKAGNECDLVAVKSAEDKNQNAVGQKIDGSQAEIGKGNAGEKGK